VIVVVDQVEPISTSSAVPSPINRIGISIETPAAPYYGTSFLPGLTKA
jgi:hypothetical protein